MNNLDKQYKYHAFISYIIKDEKWANWLKRLTSS